LDNDILILIFVIKKIWHNIQKEKEHDAQFAVKPSHEYAKL